MILAFMAANSASSSTPCWRSSERRANSSLGVATLPAADRLHAWRAAAGVPAATTPGDVTTPAVPTDPAVPVTAPTPATPVATTALPQGGLYAGPGSRTTSAVAGFASWAGMKVSGVLDFPPETAWTGNTGLTGPSWLLGVHQGTGQRLEYSLPMFPAVAGTSLAQCATGAYDTYWAQTGRNLVAYGQGHAIVRPGWEFNGS